MGAHYGATEALAVVEVPQQQEQMVIVRLLVVLVQTVVQVARASVAVTQVQHKITVAAVEALVVQVHSLMELGVLAVQVEAVLVGMLPQEQQEQSTRVAVAVGMMVQAVLES